MRRMHFKLDIPNLEEEDKAVIMSARDTTGEGSTRLPARINFARFPGDFFRGLKRKVDQLPHDPHDIVNTPKFNSQPRTDKKDQLGHYFSKHASPSTKHQSNTSQGTRRTDKLDEGRTLTAREMRKISDETDICNHLREIIRLTTSMKKVSRKQSLELERDTDCQPSLRFRKLNSLELPPINLGQKIQLLDPEAIRQT